MTDKLVPIPARAMERRKNLNTEVRNLYNIRNYSYYWIHYDLVVLIISFIVYCVKMYVHKLNIRDKI